MICLILILMCLHLTPNLKTMYIQMPSHSFISIIVGVYPASLTI